MNPLTEGLLRSHPVERILLDDDLCILAYSGGAARFAVGGELRPGTAVLDAFPEIVGAEDILHAVAAGTRVQWQVRGIDRSDTAPRFITVTVTRSAAPPAVLDMVVEDVTEFMTLARQVVQHANDTMLLLNDLAAFKGYIERIVESLADALFIVDAGGRISTVNQAAVVMFGHTRETMEGLAAHRLFDNPDLLAGIQACISSGTAIRHLEIQCNHSSGEPLPAAFSISPVTGGFGQRPGAVLLCRDLSERIAAASRIERLETERVYLLDEIRSDHNNGEIIGTSAAVQSVLQQVNKVAETDSTVLIRGETGTGKELVARAIHRMSRRGSKVMVKVNCAALPSGLVESELFGHEKGAFTGATVRRIGRFELAHEGTLFLDEVGELSADMQAKLLRVLQEQEFERVGGSATIRVDTRVLAATNRNLEEAVRNGTFRKDLYYRLNIFPITVAPLRDRRDDIPMLVNHFVGRFSRKTGKPLRGVSGETMALLARYDWPGNIRELASVLERAVIMTEGNLLTRVDLPSRNAPSHHTHHQGTLEEIERSHILETLRMTSGIIEGPKGAALMLGLNPATLRSRMRKLGITRTGSVSSTRVSHREI